MKTTIIFIFFLISTTFLYPHNRLTPLDLGLQYKYGSIDINAMTSGQKDTIAVALFNPDDFYQDIAVYYSSKDKIIIYKNLANGSMAPLTELDIKGKKIHSIKAVYDDSRGEPDPRANLLVTYADKSKELVRNHNIIYKDQIENKAPVRDPFDDPRVFVYDIQFIQQWESFRSGVPDWRHTDGDIDRDGKNEIIYNFYQITDTGGSVFPVRVVIFENVSQNQYVIDWDTTLYTPGSQINGFNITDYDEDGNLEFMANSTFSNFGVLPGFIECYGPGNYKYLFSGYSGGTVYGVEYRDSVTISNNTTRGAWMLYTNFNGNEPSFFKLYGVSGSTSFALGFGSNFNGVIYSGESQFIGTKCYTFAVGDIDGDGKDEIVCGDAQWTSGVFNYMDSTGIPTNYGYEFKHYTLNAQVNCGWPFLKDMDGDGIEEIVTLGFGNGAGNIGIIKHTGPPGSGNFEVVYMLDSATFAMPNLGMDTNYIDGKFSILYPCGGTVGNPYMVNTFTRNSQYGFYKSSYFEFDSSALIGSKFIDMDNDGKMNIISPRGYDIYPSGNAFINDFEQLGTLSIQQTSNEIPWDFTLYQNYPNPFNAQTTIAFDINIKGNYKLEVYDVTGRRVDIIFNETFSPGKYTKLYNAGHLSSGVYFYRITGPSAPGLIKKFMLVK